MGAAMAPHGRGWSRGATYGGLFFMADEIWAFALRRGAERPLTPAYYFGLSLPLYLGWIATTTLGAIFGGVLQDPARYGLDFAFTAVFRSEEHTSELQSLMRNSYAVFCLKKKKNQTNQ